MDSRPCPPPPLALALPLQPCPSSRTAIKLLSLLPYNNKEQILRCCRISPYQATASPLLFTLFQTIYSKLLQSSSRQTESAVTAHCQAPPLQIASKPSYSTSTSTSTSKSNAKLLILLDYDDTLIPSSFIKQKGFRITERNLTDTEREALDFYVASVNAFVDTLLRLVDNNAARNIKIVTNGSSAWVRGASFYQSGSLFAELMRPLHTKLINGKIDIISAHDHKEKEAAKFAEISLQHIKPYLMKLILYEQLGYKLQEPCLSANGAQKQEIKIVSIGDSPCEFHAAATALKYYLKEQSPEALKHVNVSLHRIKFVAKPDSGKLGDELKWCTQNMHDIVFKHHVSKDYYL